MRTALITTLLTFPAIAAPPAEFLGTWGTQTQCERGPIMKGGTRLSAPIELSEEWLKHGDQWCLLKWGPVEQRPDQRFTAVNAQCGEDSNRNYFIGLTLAQETLTIRWGYIAPTSEPMSRCEAG